MDDYKEFLAQLNKIEVQLARLTSLVEHDRTAVMKSLDEMNESLEKFNHVLNGNGQTGLLTRVDRLEQIEENRKWSLRLLWGTVAGVLAKLFHSIVVN